VIRGHQAFHDFWGGKIADRPAADNPRYTPRHCCDLRVQIFGLNKWICIWFSMPSQS